MISPNDGYENDTPIGQWLGRAIERWRGAPRAVAVSLEEPDLLKRTAHVRRQASSSWVDNPGVPGSQVLKKIPAETMGEFYARTGLGKSQLLAMTAKEIAEFIAAHEDDGIRQPTLAPDWNLHPKDRPVRAVMMVG